MNFGKQNNMKKVLVLGAGGFIGSHLVKKLKEQGCWIRGVDLKYPEFELSDADDFVITDLRNPVNVKEVLKLESYKNVPLSCKISKYIKGVSSKELYFDEVYQLAADMGGAGYIFSGNNDANVMHNSAIINLNVANECVKQNVKKLFYSSSACVYPEHNQSNYNNPNCEESSVYPANPDSEYGWEKLFSERLFLSFNRNYKLDIRIARFHNIFGPFGTYKGGKEKVPAAICRKVSKVLDGGEIEVWGDGKQTRSFLYIDECIEGILRLMESDFTNPINIGSDEMISINDLANYIIDISGKKVYIKHIDGPLGVKGRNSDNNLIMKELNWSPKKPLYDGLIKTFEWINKEINK